MYHPKPAEHPIQGCAGRPNDRVLIAATGHFPLTGSIPGARPVLNSCLTVHFTAAT